MNAIHPKLVGSTTLVFLSEPLLPGSIRLSCCCWRAVEDFLLSFPLLIHWYAEAAAAHVFPYASAFTSCGVSVGLEGSRYADKRREIVTRLIFRVNSGWGIRGCDCLTFTPFSKALSDPRVSVSGWITMIGSEGETEVTGTTRTKTVRNKSSAGRRRRPPSSLKPPHSQCSNIALFIHHCDEQQHKEILYRLILGHCGCKWLPASNINVIALIH